MTANGWIIFFLFALHAVQANEEILRWAPRKEVQKPLVLTDDKGDDIWIDGSVPYQIILKITNALPLAPKIFFSCKVQQLKPDFKIESASFCMKTKASDKNEICHTLSDSHAIAFANNKNTWTKNHNEVSGAIVTTKWDNEFKEKQREDVSGLYYCKLKNKRGSLLSAILEIQDVAAPFSSITVSENTMLKVDHLNTITYNDLPLTLTCPGAFLPKLRWEERYNMVPMLSWKLCPVKEDSTPNQCHSELFKNAEDPNVLFGHYDTTDYGQLAIYVLNEGIDHTNYALICYQKAAMANKFGIIHGGEADAPIIRGLSINVTAPSNNELETTGETSHTIAIREGKRSVEYKLNAHFRGDMRNIDSVWYKDGKILPKKTGREAKYHFSLGDTITKDLAGNYSVTMTHQVTKKSLEFTWYITVTYPPVLLEESFDPLKYVIEKGNWSTQIKFDNAKNLAVFVNGEPLVTTSQQDLEEDWNKKRDSLTLSGLNPSVSPYPLAGSEITYSVSNLPVNGDHTVTFEGSNEFGSGRATRLLRVVPLPVFTETLKDVSCSRCNLTDPLTLKMVHDPNNKKAIIATGVMMSSKWFLNGEEVQSPNGEETDKWKYIKVNEEEGTLVIDVKNDNKRAFTDAKKMLENASIAYLITIQDPEDNSTIYNSSTDSKFVDGSSSIQISMVLTETPTVTEAGFAWWWILLLILLLLIILTIICIFATFKRRKPGQTYLVDEKEREKGRVPTKELDDDTFHDYPPGGGGESEPIVKPKYVSPNESAAPLRNGPTPDDLDSIDLDPNAFNEDGSFIYKYRPDFSQRSVV